MTRKLKYTLLIPVGAIATLMVATILLLASETGSRWLVQYGADSIPDRFKINSMRGSILGELEFFGVDYRDDTQHASIEKVRLHLRPLALLGGKLHIYNLYVEGITYDVPLKSEAVVREAMQQFNDISQSFKISIENAKLKRLVLRREDNQYKLDDLHLSAQIDQNHILIEKFEAAGKDIRLNLVASVRPSPPYTFQVKTDWNAPLPNGMQARGIGSITGDQDKMELIHNLREPLLINTRGEVHIERILTDIYRLAFSGEVAGQNLPSTRIQGWGQGNLAGFDLKNFVTHTLGGEIAVTGRIGLQSFPGWEFNVRGTNINPGELWSLWPGDLAFETNVRGAVKSGMPAISVNGIKVAGLLLEQPFMTTGDLAIDGHVLTIRNVEIQSGKNRLHLNGKADDDLNLQLDFDIADPFNLWTGFRGHVKGKGLIMGKPEKPVGTIALTGNNMGYGDYALHSFKADLTVNLDNTHQSNGRFRVHDLRVADEVFPDASLNWTGDFKQHRVDVEFRSAATPVEGELEFTGGCHRDNCEFKVEKASFVTGKHGAWRLFDPVNVFLSYEEIKPFDACWAQGKSKLCVTGFWNDKSGWQAKGDMSAPSLVVMTDLLKEVLNKKYLGWEKKSGY